MNIGREEYIAKRDSYARDEYYISYVKNWLEFALTQQTEPFDAEEICKYFDDFSFRKSFTPLVLQNFISQFTPFPQTARVVNKLRELVETYTLPPSIRSNITCLSYNERIQRAHTFQLTANSDLSESYQDSHIGVQGGFTIAKKVVDELLEKEDSRSYLLKKRVQFRLDRILKTKDAEIENNTTTHDGESITLPAALVYYSELSGQEIGGNYAATGQILENGKIISVKWINEKIKVIVEQRPHICNILYPSVLRDKIEVQVKHLCLTNGVKLIPVECLRDAIEIVFGANTFQDVKNKVDQLAGRKEEVIWHDNHFDFEDLRYLFENGTIGRSEEFRVVFESIDAWLRKGHGGTFWIGREMGMGKSAFMYALSEKIAEKYGSSNIVIKYFFRGANDEHRLLSPKEFYKAALITIWRKLGRVSLDLQGEESYLKEQFVQLLSDISREESRMRVILIVDGLDEIIAKQNSFVDFLFQLHLERYKCLCIFSGQPVEQLNKIAEKFQARQMPKRLLAELDYDQTKELILAELSKDNGIFIDLTEEKRKRFQNETFIHSIYRSSRGIPLFIKFVLTDRCLNEYEQDRSSNVPDSFIEYVMYVMDRETANESLASRLLKQLLSLLSLTYEPLSEEIITEILRQQNIKGDFDQQFQLALQKSTVFLYKYRSYQNGIIYWDFRHDMFKKYFTSSDKYGDIVELMKGRISEWCSKHWRDEQNKYALRYYITHLKQAGKYEEILSLLDSTNFLEEQKEKFPFQSEILLYSLWVALDYAIKNRKILTVCKLSLYRAQYFIGLSQSPLESYRMSGRSAAEKQIGVYDTNLDKMVWHLLLAWDCVVENKENDAILFLKHFENKLSSSISDGFYASIFTFLISQLIHIKDISWENVFQSCKDWHKLMICRMLTEINSDFALEFLQLFITSDPNFNTEEEKNDAFNEIIDCLSLLENNKAVDVISLLKDERRRDEALKRRAQRLTKELRIEEATKLISLIKDEASRSWVWCGIAVAAERNHLPVLREQAYREMKPESFQWQDVIVKIEMAIETKNKKEAERLIYEAAKIVTARPFYRRAKSRALAHISLGALKIGITELGKPLFLRALNTVSGTNIDKANSYLEIAQLILEIPAKYEWRKEILDLIFERAETEIKTSEAERIKLLAVRKGFALIYAQMNFGDKAKEIIKQINYLPVKLQGLRELVGYYYAASKDYNQLLEAVHPNNKIDIVSSIAHLMTIEGKGRAARDLIEKTLLQKAPNKNAESWGKIRILGEVAAQHFKFGQLEQCNVITEQIKKSLVASIETDVKVYNNLFTLINFSYSLSRVGYLEKSVEILELARGFVDKLIDNRSRLRVIEELIMGFFAAGKKADGVNILQNCIIWIEKNITDARYRVRFLSRLLGPYTYAGKIETAWLLFQRNIYLIEKKIPQLRVRDKIDATDDLAVEAAKAAINNEEFYRRLIDFLNNWERYTTSHTYSVKYARALFTVLGNNVRVGIDLAKKINGDFERAKAFRDIALTLIKRKNYFGATGLAKLIKYHSSDLVPEIADALADCIDQDGIRAFYQMIIPMTNHLDSACRMVSIAIRTMISTPEELALVHSYAEDIFS